MQVVVMVNLHGSVERTYGRIVFNAAVVVCSMRKFLIACRTAKKFHPIMFRHFTAGTRRAIVRYWLPEQLNLFTR